MEETKFNIITVQQYSDYISEQKDLRNQHATALNRCYEIVADFIIRRKRILVGGMAIDYAAKARGSTLYNSLNIDYDFISPDYHRDAYDLGSILAKEFDEISVISARHVSTMRVRYLFMPVADITYVPDVVYRCIPTIQFRGMQVIHPHTQHIDQMRALRTTAENPPQETFLSNRVEKDITRFLLLYKLYPYEEKKYSHANCPTLKVSNGLLGGRHAVKYHFKIDCDVPLSIYTDNVEATIKELNAEVVSNHPPLLDKLPPCTVVRADTQLITIYNTKHSLHLSNSSYISAYGVATECATRAMFYKDTACISVLPSIMNAIARDFQSDFSLLQGVFYGASNLSDAYLLEKSNIAAKASGMPFVSQIPRNAYPNKGESVKKEFYEFDPAESPILQLAGELNKVAD